MLNTVDHHKQLVSIHYTCLHVNDKIDRSLTSFHVINMSKMVQIRHLPDDVHKQLKIRAIQHGTSLSEYLAKELTRIANTPLLDEVLERIQQREQVVLSEDSASAVRAERDAQ